MTEYKIEKGVLSVAERDSLNEAMAILEAKTAQGASWQFCGGKWGGCEFSYDVTYFDSNEGIARGQYNWLTGDTFADKVETALAFEEKATASTEVVRAERVAALKAELAELEGKA